MDKNRVKGAVKEATGSIKEAAGKLTGNDRLKAEGAAEKIVGKIQGQVGKAKDAIKNALR
ncbi:MULTISPECIES: CsbD family protein [unclassified Rhizobium]|uniref:CsbD family protein n=1 Tax=unclassified Rhizobium TaxID=2613769 RepID=UPI000EA9950F|nr:MULTISPECIES: CsbD family protein [unclassified Rhizobium]AYG68461.1 CsbD family protein [Rhizobium sp. CCGE531]AYG74844.1 CsbD family protein [Rhizobium sp. CCGE532]